MWGFTSPRRYGISSSATVPTVHSSSGSSRTSSSTERDGESELLVLSFRSHHNAYSEADGSGATIERYPCPTSLSFQVIQFIFSFIIVHYLLYWLPMLAVLLVIARYVSQQPAACTTWQIAGYWWLSVLLVLWYSRSYLDRAQFKTGRAWNWFRQNHLWYLAHQYCELELVRTAKLDPARKYIFAVYPHGILIISRIGLYGGTFERLFPGIDTRTLGASPMFWVPGAREICLWMGAVDARKKTAKRVLDDKSNLSLFIYPGGSKEIFLTNPNSRVTTLIARRGFIRLALEQGCDLVPTMVFREKYMYNVYPPPRPVVQFFLRVLKTPVLLFAGRFFTWLPFHTYLSITFDAPIAVQRVDSPTEQQVEELWLAFKGRVEGLWNKYKTTYGYGDDEQLEIRDAAEDAEGQSSSGGSSSSHSTADGADRGSKKRD